MVIVNIRGTNGSGKSTVARAFLGQPLFGCLGLRRPEAYRKEGGWSQPLYVIGPYVNPTGGVDALSGRGFDFVIGLLDKYQSKGHVLFEGVVMSNSFGQVGEWLQAHKTCCAVLFLDTPLEDCLEAVRQRSGPTAGLNRIAEKIEMIARTRRRMEEVGIPTETVSRSTAVVRINSLLSQP